MIRSSSTLNNRYQLHERLGAGGMGVVYRATDRLHDQTVALKQVKATVQHLDFNSRSLGTDLREALAREFQLLAGLRHPHIIEVLDYGFDAGSQPYYTMDYLESARPILQAARSLDLAGKIELLIQILQALDYLHRHQVIHRDLKPANVLVTPAGTVRVLDFGLALRDAQASPGGGTLAYLAPEIFQGQPITHSADLYATGVVAFEMLAGHRPFPASDLKAMMSTSPPTEALDAPSPLREVIGRLLAKTPAERYPDAAAVIEALCQATDCPRPREDITIRESHLQGAVLVGRQVELKLLTNALQRIMAPGAGELEAWLVAGESGVGKSRLLDELRIHALVNGVTVISGIALEDGGLPYQLWREVLPPLLLNAELSPEQAATLRPIVPQVERLTGHPLPDNGLIGSELRHPEIKWTLPGLFRAQPGPMLLLLDDLQWMRDDSRSLLEHLLDTLSGQPLMVVGSFRNDEAPNLAAELPQMRSVVIERLSPKQIATLSRAMLGRPHTEPELLELLERETEGNAFFLVEVMRELAHVSGGLPFVGQRTLPTEVLTGGVRAVIERRLGRLPANVQPLLKLAAVAGRHLDLALLRHLDAANLDELLLVGAEVAVLDVFENRWRFAHDRLRRAVLDGLKKAERAALHRRVAEAIEAVYAGELKVYAHPLTEHWQQAGDERRALAYIPDAVDQLTQTAGGFPVALKLIERGLATLQQHPDAAMQIRLLLEQAAVHEQQGEHDAAERIYRTAHDLAQHADQPAYEAEILGGLSWTIHTREGPEAAITLAEQSLAISRRLDDLAGVGKTLHNLAVFYKRLGKLRQATEYEVESLAISRARDNASGIANSLSALGDIAYEEGDYRQAIIYQEESLAYSRRANDRWNMGISLNTLGMAYFGLGDLEEARRHYEASLAVFRDINPMVVATLLLNLGGLSANQGDFQQALVKFEESAAILRQTGHRRTLAANLLNQGETRRKMGHLADAISQLEEALAILTELGNQGLLAMVHAYLTLAQLDRQQREAARHHLQTALRLALEVDSAHYFTAVGSAVVRWLRCTGDTLASAEWAGLLHQHPATDPDAHQLLDEDLAALRESLPADELAPALARGQSRDLATSIQQALASLS
jgi:tetratricopeptide (TPR) repeat protein